MPRRAGDLHRRDGPRAPPSARAARRRRRRAVGAPGGVRDGRGRGGRLRRRPDRGDHSGLAEVAAGLGENGVTFDGTAADLEARLAGAARAFPEARSARDGPRPRARPSSSAGAGRDRPAPDRPSLALTPQSGDPLKALRRGFRCRFVPRGPQPQTRPSAARRRRQRSDVAPRRRSPRPARRRALRRGVRARRRPDRRGQPGLRDDVRLHRRGGPRAHRLRHHRAREPRSPGRAYPEREPGARTSWSASPRAARAATWRSRGRTIPYRGPDGARCVASATSRTGSLPRSRWASWRSSTPPT